MKFDYDKLAKALLQASEGETQPSSTMALSEDVKKDSEDKAKEKLENCQLSDDGVDTDEEESAGNSTGDSSSDPDGDGLDTEGETHPDNQELPPSPATKASKKMKAGVLAAVIEALFDDK